MVAVRAALWNETLRSWLEWRRAIFQEHGMPAGFELHAQKFVTGRGNPAPQTDTGPQPRINVDKPLRRALYIDALRVVSKLPLRILTVHQLGTDKMSAYRELLARIESFLAAEDGIGVVVVDGLDEGHRAEHRELTLATRRILEDPWMQPAHTSQFIQIADLVAHAAFQAAVTNPDRAFMWSWYPSILAPLIVSGSDDILDRQRAENDTSPGRTGARRR